MYLKRIVGTDILWSVNNLARTVTKLTRACDKRLTRLISCILLISDFWQYYHMDNTTQYCRLTSFQDSDFADDLTDSKSISGGILCIFGNRIFVPISWMCKKQTSASHSSTKSEIISLDTGLRMDGLSALDLRDVMVEVLRSSNSCQTRFNPAAKNCSRNHKSDPNPKGKPDVEQLSYVDYVFTDAHSSQDESQLYIFEDNEVLIKMIIKSRSPTMRHVSRSRRVSLDYLFDRINLGPEIQIKYVDFKNQLANILIKSSFTRDEWHHLLRYWNIMFFSMFFCSHFHTNRKQSVMSKRAQEKYSERGVGSDESETNEFDVKESPECEERSSARFEWSKQSAKYQSKSNNVFPRETTRWYSSFQHQETGTRRGYPIRKTEVTLPQHADLRSSIPWESLQESAKKLNLAGDAPVIGIEALKTNVLIWWLFISTTMEVVIHLGSNYVENFGSIQEHELRVTSEFIRYHSEVDTGLSSRDSKCDNDWLDISVMDEIYTFSQSSDHVDDSKSTRLLRFCLIHGENVRSFRSESKMIK